MAVLREERDTWNVSYEEAMTKGRMVKTLKGIKGVVWGYMVNDLSKIRSHLKFYLEFDTLQK